MEDKKTQRKSERGIKSFAGLMSLLVVVVAALTVRGYNGYDPNPNSVAITGFVMIVALLLTAVWYRTKYPGYSNDGTED
ncbi:MAG: hypothetical protein M1285_03045 [Candidatus Thermoplasmatota archaeon]|jgi:hypothetical protein|nr:hypothetical protein [Candidatus Thermoplasmatota archaeon]WMT43936.1 MAG: hypothetical protein RE469_06935 [Cuniculiplasma divulgatum]